MSYTLQQFRDLVRLHIDLDIQDLPDSLVDEFVRDAVQKLQFHRSRWPFYATSWTFDTVAGTADYTLATIAGAGDAVAEIAKVRGPSRELVPQSVRAAESMAPLGITNSGTPKYWSQWGTTVTLDPVPSQIETLTVRGWAQPSDWTANGSGAQPDTPEPFDRVIMNWALGRAYSQQDQPQSALYYLDLGDLRLKELTKQYDDLPAESEVVLNGGERTAASSDLVATWTG